MKVSFIGAGPGAPDLITLRGARRLGECPLVLYAGSLVPEAVLEHAHPDAECVNTAPLNLDEQVALYRRAQAQDLDVARVHSGDPAIYGATAEQMRALRSLGIEYEVVPGVSSFTASAAVLGAELTRPGVTQTVILTRASGRASPVPDAENLRGLAAHRASLCVFLGGRQLPQIVTELLEAYAPHTPAALVQRPFPATGNSSDGIDVTVDPDRFAAVVGADVDPKLMAVLAVSQRPLAAVAFSEAAPVAAWRSRPTWAVVCTSDTAINPDVQRFGYQRAGATVIEIDSSHLVMLSRPDDVVDLIESIVAALTR